MHPTPLSYLPMKRISTIAARLMFNGWAASPRRKNVAKKYCGCDVFFDSGRSEPARCEFCCGVQKSEAPREQTAAQHRVQADFACTCANPEPFSSGGHCQRCLGSLPQNR